MAGAEDATVHRWEDLPKDVPMDKLDRRRIIGERFMVSDVFLHAGCIVPSHSHENEQMAMVMSGRVKFGLGEGDDSREQTLGAGEVLHLPANVAHSAEALENTRILDIFSPVSEKTGIDEADG